MTDAKGHILVQPEQGHVYAWDVLRDKVLGEKAVCLQSFFHDADNGHGNAMLYNLVALLREAENDGMLICWPGLPRKRTPRNTGHMKHFPAG